MGADRCLVNEEQMSCAFSIIAYVRAPRRDHQRLAFENAASKADIRAPLRWLLLFVLVIFIGHPADARTDACRQSWMPADAPAFCAWSAEPSLPEARTYHAMATHNTQIYVLGGYQFDATTSLVHYYDSVLRSVVAPDGHLSAWRPEPSFANARSGAAAAAVGDCLFLSGGSSSTPSSLTYYNDVQSALIRNDGSLSQWTTSPNHLTTARSNHSMVIVTSGKRAFLVVVAGVTQAGGDTVHLDTIETAEIGPNCTVGSWTPAHYHLKGGRSTPQAVVLRNNIVVIGGWGDLDLIDIYDDVQIAAARADGSPAPWRTSPTRLTTGLYGHGATIVASLDSPNLTLLLTLGGQPGSGAYANWVSYAYVAPDTPVADAIGVWRIAPSGRLPIGRAGVTAAALGDRVYVVGGNDADGRYDNDVLSAQFDFGRP